LHDVGKIRVPDRVLRKPGKLDREERMIVEEHVVVGAWMVSSVGSADVVSSVRHHHERWDGRGYPDGLAGTDIPLFARIIAVADAYDAITSTRPYRASAGRDDAIDVLRAGTGTQFDPEVVEAFVSALPSRIPVAAGLFILFGGPGRLFRQLGLWFRRLGVGSLTPAAGATGAAIVLGASIFTPSVVQERSSFVRQPAVAHTPAPHRSPVVVVDNNDHHNKQEPQKHEHKRPKPHREAPTHDSAPVTVAAAPAPAPAPAPHNDNGKNDDPESHEPAPHPSHSPQPPPSPTPAPADHGGDPQPDHGNDCASWHKEKHLEKHCGE
jgi:hypothetical protein